MVETHETGKVANRTTKPRDFVAEHYGWDKEDERCNVCKKTDCKDCPVEESLPETFSSNTRNLNQ